MSAGELSALVVTAASLVPDVDMRQRVVPYVNLHYNFQDNRNSGRIIGSKNPLLESKKEFWDILCYLENGVIVINDEIKNEFVDIPKKDKKFFKRLFQFIDKKKKENIRTQDLERLVKSHFREHTLKKMYDIDKFLEDEETNIMTFNQYFEQEEKTFFENKNEMDHQIRRLRNMNETGLDMIQVFQVFRKELQNDNQILEFLTYFPKVLDGLFPIGVFNFAKERGLVVIICYILKLLEANEFGKILTKDMNFFIVHSFTRNLQRYKIEPSPNAHTENL